MGFRRIGFVWFFSLLSAVFFVVLAVSLPEAANDAAGAAARRPLAPFDEPKVQHAIDHPKPGVPQDPAPMLEARAGNVDRRGVIVPVTRAGALLSAEANLVLP